MGACSCRPGFAGMQCDRCIQPGFYGFPMCQRCDCHPMGTDTLNSNGHQQDGQCSWKANRQRHGRHCDTCKDSTFGLLQVGPASTETDQQHQELMTRHSFDDGGCTPCFCFGRSSSCTQTQLFCSQVKMSTPFHLCNFSTPLLGSESNPIHSQLYHVRLQAYPSSPPPPLVDVHLFSRAEAGPEGRKYQISNSLKAWTTTHTKKWNGKNFNVIEFPLPWPAQNVRFGFPSQKISSDWNFINIKIILFIFSKQIRWRWKEVEG